MKTVARQNATITEQQTISQRDYNEGLLLSRLNNLAGGDMGLGGPTMGICTVTSNQLGNIQHNPQGSQGVIGYPTPAPMQEHAVKTNIAEAVKIDLDKQGHDVDPARLARATVRAIRGLSDDVFKAAGVDPKYHKANFVKVIDQIMKGL